MNADFHRIHTVCDLKPLERICPLCTNKEGYILGHLDYAHFDDCLLSKSMDVVTCLQCGLVYYDTPSTQTEYDNYYKQNAYYLTGNAFGMGALLNGERKRYHETADIIEKHMPTPTKMVLDIGCGKGGMLQILRNRNYGIGKLCGVDMLPEVVQYLNTLEGIKGLSGTITNIPVGDQEADVIILSHILEHVINLDGALQGIDRIISNKGIVYVEVPAARQYPTFEESPLFDFLFEHINHFDYIHLCNLFASNGFVMVEHGAKTIDSGCSKNNCIYAVFQKGAPKLKRHNHALAKGILRCFEMSRRTEFSELNQLIDNGHPVYVWGMSSYMMIMLSQWPLKRCNIISLLDKDIYKQQKTIAGRKIRAPEILNSATSDAVVVIPAGSYVSNMKDYTAHIGYKGQLIII